MQSISEDVKLPCTLGNDLCAAFPPPHNPRLGVLSVAQIL